MAPITLKRIRITTPPLKRKRFGKIADIPRTLRPGTDEQLRIADLKPSDEIVIERRKIRYPQYERENLEARAVPIEQVFGSIWERIVYKELLKRQVPFDFQSSLHGGRVLLGGIAADFLLLDRPAVIEVQSLFWHSGVLEQARDAVRADLLYLEGYEVWELWQPTIEDPYLLEEWMRSHIDQPLVGHVPETTLRIQRARRERAA